MIASVLEPDEFAGSVCVVTGAARGIGAAIAEVLASRGGAVVIADIDGDAATARAQSLMQDGYQATACRVDVRDGAGVESMFQTVADRIGPPTVLINNAGLVAVAPSEALPETDWRRQIDVMLTGTFLCSQAAAVLMLQRGGGAIVSIGSIGGFGGHPGRSAYNAAKAGIANLTQVLGAEWADRGIRVNAVAPGVTRTEMLRSVLAQRATSVRIADYERRTPLRRLAEPQEVAECVAFLASRRASFITGVTLAVDGGWLASAGLDAGP